MSFKVYVNVDANLGIFSQTRNLASRSEPKSEKRRFFFSIIGEECTETVRQEQRGSASSFMCGRYCACIRTFRTEPKSWRLENFEIITRDARRQLNTVYNSYHWNSDALYRYGGISESISL